MRQPSRFAARCAVQSRVDRFHHAIDVCRDVVIPKAKDPIALALKPRGSLAVAYYLHVVAMLRAIDFNQQFSGHTGKISDETAD
jgi:hypothetical protein